MNVKVRYFAALRDRAGCAEERLATESVTARQLVDELIVARNLALPTALIRIAVNGAFVEDHWPLSDGDEVLLLPPVAGG